MIVAVIYYSARILQMSGISNSVSTILWISCGVNAINFFASFIGKIYKLNIQDGSFYTPRPLPGGPSRAAPFDSCILLWYCGVSSPFSSGVYPVRVSV